MSKLFCSIDTPQRQELVNELKKKFPEKADIEIITEINTASQNLAIGGELTTVAQMQEYYKSKENIYREGENRIEPKGHDKRLGELKKKDNVTVSDILDLVTEDSEFYGIAKLLKEKSDLFKDVSVKLTEHTGLNTDMYDRRRGYYDASSKTVYIDTIGDYYNGNADSVILHELMHGITVNRIVNNKQYREQFDKIIDEYRKKFPISDRYRKTTTAGIENPHYMEEFIADVWSNRTLINQLKSIESTKKLTLWDKIKQFFTKIFAGSDKTLLAEASDAIYKLLDEPESRYAEGIYYEPIDRSNLVDQSVLDEVATKTFASTQQREDRVLLVARMISNTLTSMMQEAGAKDSERKQFLIANINDIADSVKSSFSDDVAEEIYHTDDGKITKNYTINEFKNEFKKVQDCWQTVMEEASNVLFVTEGVQLNFTDGSAVIANNNDGDQSGNDYDTRDNEEDGENSGKDGWMVKAREVDLRDTLSQQVRKVLNTIEKVDRQGNVEYDDLGFPRYLDQDYAHVKLLEAISQINNSDEFDAALEGMVEMNPWVQGVIDTLNKDQTLKAKFYQDLRKEFVPYWVQVGDKTSQVNVKPTVLYFGQQWQYNQEQSNILDKDSVYTNKRTFDRKAAEKGIDIVNNLRSQLNDREASYVISKNLGEIRKALAMIGIDFNESTIWDAMMVNSPEENMQNMLTALNVVFSGIKNGLADGTILYDEYKNQYVKIAEIFNDVPVGVTMASFREAGKNYQSYSNPSYLGRIINGIKSKNFKSYLDSEFGRYKQFFDNGEYKIDWLRKLYSSKKYCDLFDRKVVLHKDGKEFNDWSEAEYLDVMLTEFYSDPSNKTGERFAYYYIPLLSDAPSCEFIKFVRYTNTTERKPDGSYRTMEECIIPKLADVVKQEIERIDLIQKREKNPNVCKIKYFDKLGKQFLFFPELNNLKYGEKTFLQEYAEKNSINQTEAENFIQEEVAKIMYSDYQDFEKKAIKEGVKDEFIPKLREFFYNNALAYTQIVELTTTDLAFYKSLNDFQKRYKEVYAMTARLYTNSKYGKKAEKYVVLKDFEMPSKVKGLVSQALDGAVQEGRISKLDKDYILSQYDEMNAGDAQAYRSLESYRAILDMSGEWIDEMQSAFERIDKGDWNIEDFNILWQNIKPFTFSQNSIASGVEGYGDIKIPVQHKTAEYLLLAIYEKIAQNLNQSPLLTSMGEFMDKNGVDLVLFESAVKVGGQGMIELPENGLKEQYDAAFNVAYKNGIENPQIVHTVSYEDFGIITRNPEHLYDHSDVIGSQFRRLIDADLPDNATFTLDGKEYTKNEIHDLYQEILTANIIDSFNDVSEVFSNVENIEKELQREMAGNSRYSDEDRKACTLIERNGRKVFQIPLYDPIQSQRIQQLLNSIIKKKVTKQSIKRASCVQVSSVGLTDELQVRYQDAEGNLLFTEREWNNAKKGEMPRADYKRLKELKKKYSSWSDYKENKAVSQVYWEAYLPAWSKKFFGVISSNNGNLDITDIPDELRKAIGLRIPTEAKYSMQPIYIKGFLPQSNGSTIMMPADIVTTTGSDFDFDKVYLYLKEFAVAPNFQKEWNNLSPAERERWENASAENNLLSALVAESGEDQSLVADNVPGIISWMNYLRESNPERYKQLAKENKRIVEIKYDYSKDPRKQSREARNNAILNIANSILTSKYVIEQVQKPGGFNEARRVAAILDILRSQDIKGIKELLNVSTQDEAFKKLFSLKMEQAEDIAAKAKGIPNPLSPLTQTYFHAQNANGGKMIGIYAVGNASHASGQWAKTTLMKPITLFGKTYQKIDNMLNEEGAYISDTLAQFLAASVDNVKQPVLKSLSQDTEVGDITNLLARLGVAIEDIGLIMSSPMYGYGAIGYGNLTKEKVAWAINIAENDELTPEEHQKLMQSSPIDMQSGKLAELDKKSNISLKDRQEFNAIMVSCAQLMETLAKNSVELTTITQASRGESISNAAGPTIADNIVKLIKLQRYQDQLEDSERLVDTDILDMNFILDGNYDSSHIFDVSRESGVPFLQAATKCGVVGSNYLLNKLFPQTKPQVMDILMNKETGLFRYVNTEYMKNEDFARLLNSFYNDLYLYIMSQSDFFGGKAMKQDYADMLQDFPVRYKEVLKAHPELNNNGFINKLAVIQQYGVDKIVFKNSGNLSKVQKQRIANDWTQLVVSANKDIKDLGINLFRYSVLNGLAFDGPQSFVQLVPNVIKRAIPDYVGSLDMLLNYDDLNLQPFVEQFVRNRLGEKGYAKPLQKEDFERNEDGTITVDNKKVVQMVDKKMSEDGKKLNVYKNWKFVKFKSSQDSPYEYFTELSRDDANKKITYQPIDKLGIPHTFKEYYYGLERPQTIVSVKASGQTDVLGQNNNTGIADARYEETLGNVGIDTSTLLSNVPEAVDGVTGKPIC